MSIATLARVTADKVQGFAVTGTEHSPLLPTVPAFMEARFPAYDMAYWWGIATRAGTPTQIVSRLNQGITRGAEWPRGKESFEKHGARAVASSAAEWSRPMIRK
jgi:tripartite-type tricarboxylate transporter receptor subunit TctC